MKTKYIWILSSTLFTASLCIGGIAFWTMPQKSISEDEKRTLKALPEANTSTIFSGKYEKEFEEYYNDHFPLRDQWIEFANLLGSFKGKQDQEFRVINTEAPQKNTGAPAVGQTAQESKQEPDAAAEEELLNSEFTKVRGVVVVNGRVVQNFGGSKATLTPFVNLVNDYRQRLNPKVKMYVMAIPTGGDFYLPPQVNQGIKKEKENIELLGEMIAPDIVSIPAYDEIAPHKKEYIMFRTDHHWTGLGAYYAYVAFAKTAGFTPLTLEQMQYVKAEKTFLGSLFSYTKDRELKKNPDILEYYKIPNNTQVTIHKGGKQSTGALYVEWSNNYGLFLGGDHPLTHIHTDNNSGRKLLMIKDSFGNALAPYLAAHYDDIYVIDYRYFKKSIPKFMEQNNIGEFLYAHNTFAMNSQAAVKLGRGMLK